MSLFVRYPINMNKVLYLPIRAIGPSDKVADGVVVKAIFWVTKPGRVVVQRRIQPTIVSFGIEINELSWVQNIVEIIRNVKGLFLLSAKNLKRIDWNRTYRNARIHQGLVSNFMDARLGDGDNIIFLLIINPFVTECLRNQTEIKSGNK